MMRPLTLHDLVFSPDANLLRASQPLQAHASPCCHAVSQGLLGWVAAISYLLTPAHLYGSLSCEQEHHRRGLHNAYAKPVCT